jgi:CBS domain-containing protein
MKVSEVMHTPIVSISSRASLREVAELMKGRNVGAVVIVDDLGYMCGIVTDRDIAIRGVAAGRSPDAPAEAVMTREVATVPPSADLTAADALMHRRGVRRLPVADDMWRPHGMISLDDILRAFGHDVDTLVDTVRAQTR